MWQYSRNTYVVCVDIDCGIDSIHHTSMTITNSSMMLIIITTLMISLFPTSSSSSSSSSRQQQQWWFLTIKGVLKLKMACMTWSNDVITTKMMIFWTEWRLVVFIHMTISIGVSYVSFWTGMIINIRSVSWFWFSSSGWFPCQVRFGFPVIDLLVVVMWTMKIKTMQIMYHQPLTTRMSLVYHYHWWWRITTG